MEKNEDTNPWSHLPNEIEDILLREVFPRLTWDDIISLSICRVNKAWRALFSKDSLWKSVLQKELPFVDLGEGSNYYKKFLDALASFKRFGCSHPAADVSIAVRVCPCVLPFNFNSDSDFTIYYTDHKNDYILKTDECKCHEKIPTREHLLFPLICKECDAELRNNIYVAFKRGTISQQRKWVNASWIHKELELPEDLLVAKPIPNSDNIIAITNGNPKWLVLLRINDGIIHKEDLIEVTGDSLQISNDGKYVAVYTRYGLQGFVYNLHDKKTTFNFERASYHPNHCSFPVAFFTYENKEYLIAGKAWNRIDLYDPETGQSLKERDVTKNHLEYFWSTLYVSPDQKSLVSFGWVWHPIGICNKFSIENWMTDNIYAMEKGEKMLCEGFDWDYPICWIDDNTIAVWGDSNNNQDHGLPVVRSIDVRGSVPDTDNTKKKHELFAPMEEYPMEFDEYIISLNPKGIELIDVNDSHLLEIANKQQVDRVLCYNKHNKQVVSIKKKNESFVLVLSHIHYNDK